VCSLEYIRELVDEFEARPIVLCKDKEGQKGPYLKRDVIETGVSGCEGLSAATKLNTARLINEDIRLQYDGRDH
jgi:hypothetical protein